MNTNDDIRLEIGSVDLNQSTMANYYESRIQAGFPSPAQDAYGDTIDLSRELFNNPASTFCARVIGNSMIDAGIDNGDILIIDKSLTPHNGDIAVCFIDGDFTVKRITIKDDGIYLTPANKKFPELHVSPESNFTVWGVVSHIIHRLQR